jgi:hypothetical protein
MGEQVNAIDFETYIKENPVVEPTTATNTSSETKKVFTSRGNVIVPTKIKIQKSNLHNQGVFASKDILEGERGRVCPLLQLGWRSKYQSDPTIKNYMWINKKCDCKDCKIHSPVVYFPMGYGSLYNHSNEPNVSVEIKWEEQIATFKALKTILVEEELLIKYDK